MHSIVAHISCFFLFPLTYHTYVRCTGVVRQRKDIAGVTVGPASSCHGDREPLLFGKRAMKWPHAKVNETVDYKALARKPQVRL